MTLLTMLCCMLGCKAQNDTFRSLPAEEFATAIADTSIVRLDVRTAAEAASYYQMTRPPCSPIPPTVTAMPEATRDSMP